MIIAQKTKNISSLFLLLGLVGAGCGETRSPEAETGVDADILDNPETGNGDTPDGGDVDDDVTNAPADVTQRPDVLPTPPGKTPFLHMVTSSAGGGLYNLIFDISKKDIKVDKTSVNTIPNGNLTVSNNLFVTGALAIPSRDYYSVTLSNGLVDSAKAITKTTFNPSAISFLRSAGGGLIGPGGQELYKVVASGPNLTHNTAYHPTKTVASDIGKIHDLVAGPSLGTPAVPYVTFVGADGVRSCRADAVTKKGDCFESKHNYLKEFTRIAPVQVNTDFLAVKHVINTTIAQLILVDGSANPHTISPNGSYVSPNTHVDYTTGLVTLSANLVVAYGPGGASTVTVERPLGSPSKLKFADTALISTGPVTQVRTVPVSVLGADKKTTTINYLVAVQGKDVVVYTYTFAGSTLATGKVTLSEVKRVTVSEDLADLVVQKIDK